jgi:hypothetical protein
MRFPDLLRDPLIRLVMKSGGVTQQEMIAVMDQLRRSLAAREGRIRSGASYEDRTLTHRAGRQWAEWLNIAIRRHRRIGLRDRERRPVELNLRLFELSRTNQANCMPIDHRQHSLPSRAS